MPLDVGCRLGFDHSVLEPSEQILGVLQTHASSRSPLLSSCRITSSRITVSSSLTMRSCSWTRRVDVMLDCPRTQSGREAISLPASAGPYYPMPHGSWCSRLSSVDLRWRSGPEPLKSGGAVIGRAPGHRWGSPYRSNRPWTIGSYCIKSFQIW